MLLKKYILITKFSVHETICCAMTAFGFGKKAVHREMCPKCDATVVEAVEGAQSYKDFKVLVNKENFEPMEGACAGEEVFLMILNWSIIVMNLHLR